MVPPIEKPRRQVGSIASTNVCSWFHVGFKAKEPAKF